MAMARRHVPAPPTAPGRSVLRDRQQQKAGGATRALSSRRPHRQHEDEADEGEGDELAAASCPICFDSLVVARRPAGRLLRSSWAVERVWLNCGHAFCKPCLSQYAATWVQEGKTAAAVTATGGPLVCPVQGCKVLIGEQTLRELLSADDWAKHVRLAEDHEVATDPRLRHCPKPRCGGVARLSPASLALLSSNPPKAPRYVPAACSKCGHAFCAKCAGNAHPKDTCDEAGDKGFMRWKNGRPVKPCPVCGYQVRWMEGVARLASEARF